MLARIQRYHHFTLFFLGGFRCRSRFEVVNEDLHTISEDNSMYVCFASVAKEVVLVCFTACHTLVVKGGYSARKV